MLTAHRMKTPKERMREIRDARRLFFAQMMRAGTRYSIGTEILEGEALVKTRRAHLTSLISDRGGLEKSRNYHIWKNFMVLRSSKDRVQKTVMPLEDRMLTMLAESAAGHDQGSCERVKILRRGARRHFPDRTRLLDDSIRMGKDERKYLRQAMAGKSWMLAQDTFVPAHNGLPPRHTQGRNPRGLRWPPCDPRH